MPAEAGSGGTESLREGLGCSYKGGSQPGDQCEIDETKRLITESSKAC